MRGIYRVRKARKGRNQYGVCKVNPELVPISLFAGLTVIISLFFWFRYRARGDMQATIRAAIEKGQELTPELVETLGKPQRSSKNRDLRLAMIWLAIALAFSLFGFGMSSIEEEVFAVMLSIAAFPGMIGLAYLVIWRVSEREQ